MIAHPPSIPQCVTNISEVKTQSIIISGNGQKVRAFLQQQKDRIEGSELSLSQDDNVGTATAVLRFATDTPYKVIGALIYYARVAKLDAGELLNQPPLCLPDKKQSAG
jgi:hypothetical protein